MLKFILIALVVLLAIWVVRQQGDAYQRFKDNAIEVTGHIDAKETRIDNNPNTRSQKNTLIYSYAVDGKTYRGEEHVEYDDLWMDAREGMELRVYASKSNPSKSYPAALIDRRLGIASSMK